MASPGAEAARRPFQSIIDAHILKPLSDTFVDRVLRLLDQWDIVLATICFAVAVGYLSFLLFVSHHIFWDFKVYSGVVKALMGGVSPYNDIYLSEHFGAQTPFRYPPFVANIFYQLRWLFLSPIGQCLLVATHVMSWLSIPYLLAGSPENWYSRKYLYVWGLYLILFGVGGMRTLVVGNMAAFFFAIMIFSVVVAVRTKDYKFFWVSILLCSFFKFYFLVFLLIPVVLDRRYLSSCLIVCALVALYGLNWIVEPTLFNEYLSELTRISGDGGGVIGWSLYSLIAAVTSAVAPSDMPLPAIALGIHFVFVVTIFLTAYAIMQRRIRPERFDTFCCWLFMSAFLMSPRIFDYEIAMLTVPVVMLARMLSVKPDRGIVVAAIVTAAGTILLRTPASFHAALAEWSGLFLIFGIWSGSAVHWLTSEPATHSNTRSP